MVFKGLGLRWGKATRKIAPRLGARLDRDKLDQYVESADENQNAIDTIPGWNGALPPEAGVTAGYLAYYADGRIGWLIEQFGELAGRRVLEVGPMEAGHTYVLEKAGAQVHAVEANKLGFLKCLVAKEILDLKARFSLAEINAWLESTDKTFDLIVACGVLYHMRDPLGFLERVAAKSDALFIWTHVMPDDIDTGGPNVKTTRWHGLRIPLTMFSYETAPNDPAFCGGVFDRPRRLRRKDLLDVLSVLGFSDIRIAHDEPNHDAGPALSIFARKTGA